MGSGRNRGAFNLTKDTSNTSNDEDGQTVTGTLGVYTNGNCDYTGDIFGTGESARWWDTGLSPVGTWHCKLTFTGTDTNHYSSGSTLGAWHQCGGSGAANILWNFSKASAGGPDSATGTFTLEFSNDGGSTTFDSVVIAITLNEQAP